MEKYIVYVRTDSGGIITDINSSAFVDGASWIEIDRGEGDKRAGIDVSDYPARICYDVNYLFFNIRLLKF